MIEELESDLEQLRSNKKCSFYREHWGEVRNFPDLPPVLGHHLANTALPARDYSEQLGIIQLIHRDEEQFLLNKAYQAGTKLPLLDNPTFALVALANQNDAMEVSLAVYGQGSVPLIANYNNLGAAALCSSQFQVPVMIVDEDCLRKFYLEGGIPPTIEKIILLLESFPDRELYADVAAKLEVSAYLYISEAGFLAELDVVEQKLDHVFKEVRLDLIDGYLDVTKLNLAFPLVHYRIKTSIKSF